MENNNSYRVRTRLGIESPNVIHVPLQQTHNTFDILSLKITESGEYKSFSANYGIVVGRVIANGGVGVENAKVSVFIPLEDGEKLKTSLLYSYPTVNAKDALGKRYNLFFGDSADDCHQPIGTFPSKRLVLDNNDIIEIVDKYYKYTTTTNQAGDYMLFGVPTGNQIVHTDVDLSDCGMLSQRPYDMIGQGYSEKMFDSPNKFKKSTNLDSLAQVLTSDKGVYVYPYWGDTSSNNNTFAITRCDIELSYEFKTYAVFLGSIVTDKANNAIGKNCETHEYAGKMSDLITGAGRIEMIRKTPQGRVESYSVDGNRLIDSDGTWCYQVPMNLDYVTTNEFGELVPTEDPKRGIPTRARVRFRFSLDESLNESGDKKLAKYLVPNNPSMDDEWFRETKEPDFEFGSNTRESSYKDLLWNKVYTVKNYIPKMAIYKDDSKHGSTNKKYLGIKTVNHSGDNNPMPYNTFNYKMNFTYRFLCVLTKVIINLISFLNNLLTIIGGAIGIITEVLKIVLAPVKWILGFLDKITLGAKIFKIASTVVEIATLEWLVIPCIELSSDFCDDGVNKFIYFPGCGYFAGVRVSGLLGSVWKKTQEIANKDYDKYYSDKNGLIPSMREDWALNKKIPTNKTQTLYTCVENELAQQNEIVNFNFNNDWVNGVLYAPLWYRRLRKKKKYLFGLFKRRGKDEWCTAGTTHKKLVLIQHCAVNRTIDSSNSYKNFNGETIRPYVMKKEKCGDICLNVVSKTDNQVGVIKSKETSLKDTVYYYNPAQYDQRLKRNSYTEYEGSEDGESKTLLATDIVLLGSLKSCDIHGVPQFFRDLTPSTYEMPTDILFTTYDFVLGTDKDGNVKNKNGLVASYYSEEVGSDVSIVKTSEMSGSDWGNPNEFGKHDGGLFYGIGCSTFESRPKSCINVSRLCEFGVSLDMTKQIPNLGLVNDYANRENVDAVFEDLITDSYISYDEITLPDGRSMFASMNMMNLAIKFNTNNGLTEYNFKYLYPENFDGSLAIEMRDNFRGYSDKISYRYNNNLEKFSEDYYKFRMGNKPYWYDGGDSTASFPRYNNSFYFYFGLKKGKTAIEKFQSKYFAECSVDEKVETSTLITPKPNSWCSVTNKSGKDGYVAFDFTNVDAPYDVILRSGVHVYELSQLNLDRFVIGDIPSGDSLSGKGYEKYNGNITINGITKSMSEFVMFDNGEYIGEVTDSDGDKIAISINLTNKSLTYELNAQNFKTPHNVLGDSWNAIARDKNGINNTDYRTIRRKIGGVITVSDVFNDGKLIGEYKVRVSGKGSPLAITDSVVKKRITKVNESWIDKDGVEHISTDKDLEESNPLIVDHYKPFVVEFTNRDYSNEFVLSRVSSGNKESFAIGVPMGDVDYEVTVTQLCNGVESQNVIIKTVTVSEPLPYKMYINDIDYELIKNFFTHEGVVFDDNKSILGNDRTKINKNVEISVRDHSLINGSVEKMYANSIFYNIDELLYRSEIDEDTGDFYYILYYKIGEQVVTQEDVDLNKTWFTEDGSHHYFTQELVGTTVEVYKSIGYDIVYNEFSKKADGVLYNWEEKSYLTKNQKVPTFDSIDGIVRTVNEQLSMRKTLLENMRRTFYLECSDGNEIEISYQSDDLPVNTVFAMSEEEPLESGSGNYLVRENRVRVNTSRVSDIRIPTISYNSNPEFGKDFKDDKPCYAVDNNGNKYNKLPYAVGIMNAEGYSIPSGSESMRYEEGGLTHRDRTNTGKNLFNFPILDKRTKFIGSGWTSFVNIPIMKEGVETGRYNMTGFLSGHIYNDVEEVHVGGIKLILSDNKADKSVTYVDKYQILGNSLTVNAVKMLIKAYGMDWYDVLVLFSVNSAFKPYTESDFEELMETLHIEDDMFVFTVFNREYRRPITNLRVLQHYMPFKNYKVYSNDTTTENIKNYSILPPLDNTITIKGKQCTTEQEVVGVATFTLNEDSIDNAFDSEYRSSRFIRGNKSLLSVSCNLGDNLTYYIFSAGKTDSRGRNIGGQLYPLYKSVKNYASGLYQIEDEVYGDFIKDDARTSQNLFSTSMNKVKLIEATSKSYYSTTEVSDSNEESGVKTITNDGYGSSGVFKRDWNFTEPVFIVAEDEFGMRCLSPVYDFRRISFHLEIAKIKRMVYVEAYTDVVTEELHGGGGTYERYVDVPAHFENQETPYVHLNFRFGDGNNQDIPNEHYIKRYPFKLEFSIQTYNTEKRTLIKETMPDGTNEFGGILTAEEGSNCLSFFHRGKKDEVHNWFEVLVTDVTGLKHKCAREKFDGGSTHKRYTITYFEVKCDLNVPSDASYEESTTYIDINKSSTYAKSFKETNSNYSFILPAVTVDNELGYEFKGWVMNKLEPSSESEIIGVRSTYTTNKEGVIFMGVWKKK